MSGSDSGQARNALENPRVGAPPSEIPVLTGLRGVAALLVFLYHLPWLAGIKERDSLPYGAWMSGADAGVALFFCLSAYLLSRPLWEMLLQERLGTAHLERFLLRRAVRIFPAYLLVVAWSLLPDDRTATFWGIVNLFAHLSAVQTFYHQNFVWMINNVLWTVSIEVLFYVFLAFMFWLATRLPFLSKGHGGVLLLLFTVVMIGADPLFRSAIALLAPSLPPPVFGGGDAKSAVYTWNVGYFLKWFLPGIAAAWISVQTLPAPLRNNLRVSQFPVWSSDLAVILLLAPAAVLIATAGEGTWRSVTLVGWPLNVLIFAALLLVLPSSRLGNFLFGGALVTWLGTVSFGLYLWHYPILRMIGKSGLFRDLDGWAAVAAFGVVGMLASAAAAAASWYFLERRAMLLVGGCNSFGELASKLGSWERRSEGARL